MRRSLPSQERLRALFSYQDGQLLWRQAGRKRQVGSPAGCLKPSGYVAICVDYVQYQAHRLIWKWHYDSEPETIAHLNGIRHDDRIENLKPMTNQEACLRGKNRTRKLPPGVYPHGRKYQVAAFLNGKRRRLGTFGTIEEAVEVYNDALLHPSRFCG